MDHRFQNGLNVEREASLILNRWYKSSFRYLIGIIDVTSDPFFQRAGIDKFLVFRHLDVPKVVFFSIDEKVRTKPYDDILAEVWSKKEKEIPGWVWTCKADFIVYAFIINKKLIDTPFFIQPIDLIEAIKTKAKEYAEKKTKTITKTEIWTTISKTIPKKDLPSKPPKQLKLEDFLNVKLPDWRIIVEKMFQSIDRTRGGLIGGLEVE